jgi:hypothetical protein
MAFFWKINVMLNFFALTCSILSQKSHFLAKCFGELKKIIPSVPHHEKLIVFHPAFLH